MIIGGESGPHARRMELAWVRSMIKQCRAVGVPVFVKKLGSCWAKENYRDGQAAPNIRFRPVFDTGDPKGGNMLYWPQDLRVREFPKLVEREMQ